MTSEYRRHSDAKIDELTSQVGTLNVTLATLAAEMKYSNANQAALMERLFGNGDGGTIGEIKKKIEDHDKRFVWFAAWSTGAVAVLTVIWEVGKEWIVGKR